MKTLAAIGLLVSALSTTLYAQEKSFPSRPVEIIVPSSPGGGDGYSAVAPRITPSHTLAINSKFSVSIVSVAL